MKREVTKRVTVKLAAHEKYKTITEMSEDKIYLRVQVLLLDYHILIPVLFFTNS